jgi:putative addiction module antidote
MERTVHVLKLTQIGNSIGVVLPKDALSKLRLKKGESVFLTESSEGYTLTPYDPALEEEITAGREFMREYRDTFHQLAK